MVRVLSKLYKMVHIFLTPWKREKNHQALVDFLNLRSCTCWNIFVTNTTSIWCNSTRFNNTPLVHDANNNDIVVGLQFLHLVVELIKFNTLVLVQPLNGSINCVINPFLINWVNLLVNFSSVMEFFIIANIVLQTIFEINFIPILLILTLVFLASWIMFLISSLLSLPSPFVMVILLFYLRLKHWRCQINIIFETYNDLGDAQWNRCIHRITFSSRVHGWYVVI